MHKRILPMLLACLMLLWSVGALAGSANIIFLEGALQLTDGNSLIFGARQENGKQHAWCALMDREGQVQWEKMMKEEGRFTQGMEWGKGLCLVAQAGEGAACEMVCLSMRGETVKTPEMPEGTGYLRLNLESALAYGAYAGKDGGYVLRLSRMDENGKIRWQRDYSARAQGWNLPLCADDGEMMYFVGAWNQENEQTVYSILQMDAAGEILWNTALEADSVRDIHAGGGQVLVIGADGRSSFAECFSQNGETLWRFNAQEPIVDGVISSQGAYLLTESDGSVSILLAGTSGDILAQQMTEWTDAALARDKEGNVSLFAVDGERMEKMDLRERPEETSAIRQVSVEWLGMESEKSFELSNDRAAEMLEGFLQDGIVMEEAPQTGKMGQRRFEILLDDLQMEVYWNALEGGAYLRAGEIWYALENGHGEYLLNLCRALEKDTCREEWKEEHESYLRSFGWEIAWKTEEAAVRLPQSLMVSAEDERTLYWAYHHELIRLGGGSLQQVLGQEISAACYAVYSPGWYSPAENRVLTAMVLEKDGTILGGFLTQGHEAEKTWSLDGKRVEGNLSRFLFEQSRQEQRDGLVGLDARGVLEKYLNAWQRSEKETMMLCLSPKKALDEMIRSAREDGICAFLQENAEDSLLGQGTLEETLEISGDGQRFSVRILSGGEEKRLQFSLKQNERGIWAIEEIRAVHW